MFLMLELMNNKHNTYYHSTYLIFKLLLTSYLQHDLAQKNNNNNITTLICLAISVRAKFLCNPGLSWHRERLT